MPHLLGGKLNPRGTVAGIQMTGYHVAVHRNSNTKHSDVDTLSISQYVRVHTQINCCVSRGIATHKQNERRKKTNFRVSTDTPVHKQKKDIGAGFIHELFVGAVTGGIWDE